LCVRVRERVGALCVNVLAVLIVVPMIPSTPHDRWGLEVGWLSLETKLARKTPVMCQEPTRRHLVEVPDTERAAEMRSRCFA